MVAAMSAPCSVKTSAGLRRPPRPPDFDVANCDIKAMFSSVQGFERLPFASYWESYWESYCEFRSVRMLAARGWGLPFSAASVAHCARIGELAFRKKLWDREGMPLFALQDGEKIICGGCLR